MFTAQKVDIFWRIGLPNHSLPSLSALILLPSEEYPSKYTNAENEVGRMKKAGRISN